MLNPNEQYARKNPIRATFSNAGSSIYHASEVLNKSLRTTGKVIDLVDAYLDNMLIETRLELATNSLELESQATTKFSDL